MAIDLERTEPAKGPAAGLDGPPPPRARQWELLRLNAVAGDKKTSSLPAECMTLVVVNPLAAPIYIVFGGSSPSVKSYDLAIPALTMMSFPIAGIWKITAAVVYPGAVPAGDQDKVAILTVTEAVLSPFVGVLNA